MYDQAEARKLWQCGPRESIMVNELRCNEPGCPPIETVIIRKNGQEKTQVRTDNRRPFLKMA